MRPLLLLRALVYLRRISKALERIADAQEIQTIPVTPTRRPKVAEVWVATPDKMNELWREENPE